MHAILLAGAAVVGLPILLHLIMKQEPKRVLFPAVRFLKQKQKTNQRKMRLRHFLLLALRCLLLALFCLALYQPRVPSGGLVTGLGGDQPVAAVLILDATPSMGYTADNKTRLDDARRRALELLDDLPAGSKVAVLDPADPGGAWEPSVGDARRRLEGMKEPRAGGPPVTAALPTAYQLLKTVDQEAEAADPLPRLVAVFSDRAGGSWRADRADDLKALRDQVPPPAVAHLFVDVGADRPADVALVAADARPAVAPVGRPVAVTVVARATGPDVPTAVVSLKLGDAPPERREVPLKAGSPQPVTFTFKDLKPGLYQAEAAVEAPDRLAAGNVRHVTFRVGESRKLLTLTDDLGAADRPGAADLWQLAHQSQGEFGCDVKGPADLVNFGDYDAVCLLAVRNPAAPLAGGGTVWDKVRRYVDQGGKVLVAPGGEVDKDAYDPAAPGAAGVLPGRLRAVVDTTTEFRPPPADKPDALDRRLGVAWDLDPTKPNLPPLLAPLKDWALQGNVDFLRNPRKATRYWDVEAPPEAVLVRYDDSDDPAVRRPAILEKAFPGGGKVVLLTTRLDTPREGEPRWNNYWELAESSWPVVFPNLLARYLAGDPADRQFSFPAGQPVVVPLPKAEAGKPRKLVLEGPGVTGRDAAPEVGDRQPDLRLPPAKTLTAGNYVLRTEDRAWVDGFSLNPPADEFDLDKVPAEAVEAVFGPGSVVPVEKDLKLGDLLARKFDPEVRLFPWLLIGVLVLFAAEGFVANRFYRLRGGG